MIDQALADVDVPANLQMCAAAFARSSQKAIKRAFCPIWDIQTNSLFF
ncbi:MAG: hypothetical protein AAF250_08500 [Pseudomonadota bacterium]